MDSKDRELQELYNEFVQLNTILESIEMLITSDEEPSEFMLSFPVVQSVKNVVDELKYCRKEMDEVEKFVHPNWSNDMKWSDEIIIAIENREYQIKHGKEV